MKWVILAEWVVVMQLLPAVVIANVLPDLIAKIAQSPWNTIWQKGW